jgi:hypothetical protein
MKTNSQTILFNDTQTEILLALAQFKFLTTSQLQKLVPREIAWLRKQIVLISKREKPLIEKLSFGFHPKFGKLENVFCLTPNGRETLCQTLSIEREAVKMPVGNSSLFFKDYTHRRNTIDIHVHLQLWTKTSDFEIVFFDTYFDKIGNNRRDANLQAKNKIDLPNGDYLIPDAITLLDNSETQFLYLIEMYDGKDTKRVIEQLHKHAQAIALGSPSVKYGFAKSNRVLCVFEFESNRDAVLSRLHNNPAFAAMTNHFLFKTLEAIRTQDFTEGWLNLESKYKMMF